MSMHGPSQQAPQGQVYQQAPPPKTNNVPWIFGSIGGVIALCVAAYVALAIWGKEPPNAKAPDAATSVNAAVTSTAAPGASAVPTITPTATPSAVASTAPATGMQLPPGYQFPPGTLIAIPDATPPAGTAQQNTPSPATTVTAPQQPPLPAGTATAPRKQQPPVIPAYCPCTPSYNCTPCTQPGMIPPGVIPANYNVPTPQSQVPDIPNKYKPGSRRYLTGDPNAPVLVGQFNAAFAEQYDSTQGLLQNQKHLRGRLDNAEQDITKAQATADKAQATADAVDKKLAEKIKSDCEVFLRSGYTTTMCRKVVGGEHMKAPLITDKK